jgi:membrane protein implicated in regulation of membrane protease activity
MDNDSTEKSRLELFADHILAYLDTRWDLIMLNLTEKGLAAASGIVTGLLLAFFGSIVLLFVGIGTAIWIGMRLDNPAAGYFIVAGILLLLLGLAIALSRNYVHNVIAQSIIESIKEDEEDEKAS